MIILTDETKKNKYDLKSVENKIICADVLDGLSIIPSGTVSLIFSSPPYNLGINYGNRDDNQTWVEYLNWLNKVWIECARVLRKGGRLCINIDTIANHEKDNDKEYFRPVYADLVTQMRKIPGMNFRADICWYKHQVVGRATAFGSYCSCSNPVIRRNHEYIIVWSKEQWQLPGDYEQSDMTSEEFLQWTMSYWQIAPETRKMGGHPVPFPQELAKRIIKLNSYRGDIVLDPFSGSGTTVATAAALKRKYIGIDNHQPYCEYSERRVQSVMTEAIEEDYIPRSIRLKESKKKEPKEQDMFADE